MTAEHPPDERGMKHPWPVVLLRRDVLPQRQTQVFDLPVRRTISLVSTPSVLYRQIPEAGHLCDVMQ
jgi:hypothetical protein